MAWVAMVTLGATLALGAGPADIRLDLPLPERRAKVDHARDRMIADLQRISAELDDASPEKPELMFQLAELYWEKERYLYDLEMARNDRAWKTYEDAVARGEKPTRPVADHRGSAGYRRLSMRLYRQVLTKWPRYGRRDEVLFLLAYDLAEVGQRAKAAKRYTELVRHHPGSKFAPDAWIQLGNFQFDHDHLVTARHSYQQALASKVTRVHAYAIYRLAWCDLNEGKLESALGRLKRVVQLAKRSSRKTTDLRNEALKDMVRLFVRLDRVDRARAYFEATAPDGLRQRLVAALGEGLASSGRCSNAIRTWRALITASPEGPSAPEWQTAILRCEAKLGHLPEVRKEARVLAKRYGPGGAWWKAHAKNEAVLQGAFDVSEEALRTLAEAFHQEAQKTHEVRTWKLTRDLYASYLDAFARSDDPRWISDQAFDLSFYDAEVLWTLQDWADAAARYERVVQFRIPNRPSARAAAHETYRAQSGYDAILAYDELVKIERGEDTQSHLRADQKVDGSKSPSDLEKGVKLSASKEVREGGASTTPVPLTRWENALVSACDTYARRFPDGKKQIEVQYLAAVILYGRSHLRDAARRFRAIVARWPHEKRSEQAAELTLHVFELEHDWKALGATAQSLLHEKGFAPRGSALERRLEAVLAGSRYKAISATAQQGNASGSAQAFLDFVHHFPKAAEAPRALTWAMLLFEQHHQLEAGIDAGERVLRSFPDTPLRLKVLDTLASLYQQNGDFEKAARTDERFVTAYRQAEQRWRKKPKRSKRHARGKKPTVEGPKRGFSRDEKLKLLTEAQPWVPDAELDAGVWWEALGKVDRALADYRGYLRDFGHRDDAAKVAFHIGEILEGAGRLGAAREQFERVDRRHDAGFADPVLHYLAEYHSMLAARGLHRDGEARRLVARLLHARGRLPEAARRDPRVTEAYAHARLIATDPLWKRFRAIRLNRVHALRRDLRAKQRALQSLEQAYTRILALGSARWGVTALTRIGLAYADFASAIRSSPVPPGVARSEVGTYRQGLEKLAAPLARESEVALQKALKKGSDLYLYGDWTTAAQQALEKQDAHRFGAAHALPFVPGLSWRTLGNGASKGASR